MNTAQISSRQRSVSFRVVTEHADIPALINLAREAHEESRFAYIPFSPEKVHRIATMAIKDPRRHGVFLAERKGTPVGFSFCSIGEYHIGSDVLIATINNINVTKSVRSRLTGGRAALGLFQGIKSWATLREAEEIILHVTSGVSIGGIHRFAGRLGYTLSGGNYFKKL